MPCDSSYMNPTRAESNSRKMCQHLSYLLSQLDKPVPPYIVTGAKNIYGDPDKLNNLVVLLCNTIECMTDIQLDEIIYNGRSKEARALADFWDEHVDADKERVKEETVSKAEQLKKDKAEYLRLKKKLGK